MESLGTGSGGLIQQSGQTEKPLSTRSSKVNQIIQVSGFVTSKHAALTSILELLCQSSPDYIRFQSEFDASLCARDDDEENEPMGKVVGCGIS